MTIQTIKYSGLILASIVGLAGCPSDDTGGSGETDDPTTTSPSTTAPSTSSPSTSSPSTSATDSMSGTETDPMTGTESDTDPSTSTGPDPDVFMFREDGPEAYTQIDRMGLPAVNTGLILSENKDQYNADDPTARMGGDYDTDLRTSITALHVGDGEDGNGLNDDLAAIPLVPCTHTIAGGETCLDQLTPLIAAGDQIGVDTTMPAGFPNGRQPANAVMDVVLGVLLLQIGPVPGGGTQTGLEFAGVPLNPTENDVAFPDAFPYLAPAQ
jgi:hypothetical protein